MHSFSYLSLVHDKQLREGNQVTMRPCDIIRTRPTDSWVPAHESRDNS